MSLKTNIEFDDKQNINILKPIGDMDIYTSPVFKEEVLKAYGQNKTDILIDGEDLEYIDSTGLGALISILKKLKENDNNIYLTNIKPNIRKLFAITELDKLFIIRGEENE